MDPADIPTIRQILDDHDVAFYLGNIEFELLLTELENRENIMITDRGVVND